MIIVNLDVELAKKKMRSGELAGDILEYRPDEEN